MGLTPNHLGDECSTWHVQNEGCFDNILCYISETAWPIVLNFYVRLGIYHVQYAWPILEFQNSDSITQKRSNLLSSNLLFRQRRIVWVTSMCFDGGALARAQYARANFRISPELFIFFGARSFIADKGVLLVYITHFTRKRSATAHI